MISAMCEFSHIAAMPEGPEVWVELSEAIDRIRTNTPCQDLRRRLDAVATDTVLRHEEAIECFGRPVHSGDVDNPASRAYQALLDAMVCLIAVRGMDSILQGALLTQLAIVAADLRGEWRCQD